MDLRFALRFLCRTPGFSAAALVSRALGIGANTAIFSVVNAVLLRPLAYTDPGRLVVVGHGGTTVSAQTFLEWRARTGAFERIGAAEFWTPNLAGAERTDQLYALHLSSDVLPLLGVEPLVGRMFSSDEEHLGRDRVVVLGHALWKTRFAADPNVVGTAITLDGERYTIVGVMPESFRFAPFWATKAQLWVPLVLDARTGDKGGLLRIFARLKPDMTLARARAEMTALTAALDEEQGAPNVGATITPLHDMVAGDVKPALFVLLTATGLVLLIACANVAHLQLVRGAGRARELAVRTALGASRSRLVRQLLTESAILCPVGAGAGVHIAHEGLRVLVALAPSDLPRIGTVSMDARVLYFTFGVTVCASLLSALMPAVTSAQVNVNESLKSGGRGSGGGDARTALRGLLVVSEFAMAMVLLVSATLVLRSFFGLLAVDSGFDPRNVVAMDVSVAGTSQADPLRRPMFFRESIARVRALPGVKSASAINHLPLVGDLWRFSFAIEGRPLPRSEEMPSAAYRVVLPGYFQTMGIPLVKGRDITDRDVLTAPHVVVLNEFTARRYFPKPRANRPPNCGGQPEGSRLVHGGRRCEGREAREMGRSRRRGAVCSVSPGAPLFGRPAFDVSDARGAHVIESDGVADRGRQCRPRGRTARGRHQRDDDGARDCATVRGAAVLHAAARHLCRRRAEFGHNRHSWRDQPLGGAPHSRNRCEDGFGCGARRDPAHGGRRRAAPRRGGKRGRLGRRACVHALPAHDAVRRRPHRCADLHARRSRPDGRGVGGVLRARATSDHIRSHDGSAVQKKRLSVLKDAREGDLEAWQQRRHQHRTCFTGQLNGFLEVVGDASIASDRIEIDDPILVDP